MKWIALKTKRPKFKQLCATVNVGGWLDCRYYSVAAFEVYGVTHWIPLPTPPKKKL